MATPASNITDRLQAIAAPLVESLGLSIWGLEFIPGGRSIVRLYIEGDTGATIDQCADVSRLFGLSLEVEDIIPDAYMLEVSSPGLERVFFTPEQLAPYAGNDDYLELTLLRPGGQYPGRRKFNGKLLMAEGNNFTFLPHDPGTPEIENAIQISFVWEDIKKIRRVHFVPTPEKNKKGKAAKGPTPARNNKTPRADDSADDTANNHETAPNTGSGGFK